MGNKKRFTTLIILLFVTLSSFWGCANNKITEVVNELKENTGYDVEYNEEKNTIRIVDYISKDTVIEAVSKDNVYNQWGKMRDKLLDLYDNSVSFGEGKGLKDTSYEMILIDKESSKTDEEVPLLIINENGVIFDMVEEVINRQ